MGIVGKSLLIALAVICAPSLAYAQASITGVVRDASGAVLPGVTVEAASPALIEKVRTAVSDGTGQYRIENLRPGVYSVTFTLPGFGTVKREGVELAGAFTATINAELRVGALEETVTVTGEAPIVDVQNARRQVVMDHGVIDTIPGGRVAGSVALLVPGVSNSSPGRVQADVGGLADYSSLFPMAHGSRNVDSMLTNNGMAFSVGYGGVDLQPVNMSAVQEMTVDTSGVSAEMNSGGVRINLIPKEGGNRFSGQTFATFANESFQGDNFSDDLRALGLGTPDKLKRTWDINPALGGPIRQDRLWFFAAYKNMGAETYPAGAFVNKNAHDPNAWTYDPDTSSRPFNVFRTWDAQLRLTWQALPKLKVGAQINQSFFCGCSLSNSSLTAPEAALHRDTPRLDTRNVDFTAPLTNRILLDGGWQQHHTSIFRQVDPAYKNPAMISVTEQSTNRVYRTPHQDGANTPLKYSWQNMPSQVRSAVSYITGAHALKAGFNYIQFTDANLRGNQLPGAQMVAYRFNNGVPNQITLYGYPLKDEWKTQEVGVFVQDRWTVGRLTASGGLRYDYAGIWIPEQVAGPTILLPTRNFSFPASHPLSLHDVTPKMSAAYDVFGTGRTALKVNLNKYLLNVSRLATSLNPMERIGNITTRAWSDANRDFVPQCDLTAPDANGECGAMANRNFGSAGGGATYDPDMMFGWGKREYNWEFSTGVQHELMPRVSVDVGYFSRRYGNLQVTDNRAVTPADFASFSVPAPTIDSRLPSAGQVIPGYLNLNPDRVGQVANFITLAKNYGDQTERWNGVDVNLSARLQNGLRVQGGTSTGRTTINTCEIRAQLPETAALNPFCDSKEPWLTQLRVLASYVIPVIEVQTSGTYGSSPGPAADASFVASNALVQPSLGRPLSGGAANVTVPLVQPNSDRFDRVNQLDLRFGKIIRAAGTRSTLTVDIYNVLNSNPALALNTILGGRLAWLAPQSIMAPRLFKIGVLVDF